MYLAFLSLLAHCTHSYERENHGDVSQNMRRQSTLIQELKTYQSLGLVHPHDPIIAEWGFVEHGTYCNLFQTGLGGPKRSLLFSSTAFKETEQRYSGWEK